MNMLFILDSRGIIILETIVRATVPEYPTLGQNITPWSNCNVSFSSYSFSANYANDQRCSLPALNK